MDIIGNTMSRTAAEQKTESFKVQDFFLDASYFDNYNQQNRENFLKFQVTGNRIADFANIPDGSRVKVFFSIKGRFYDKQDGEKGHGQNLEAFKFEIISQPPQQQPAAAPNTGRY